MGAITLDDARDEVRYALGGFGATADQLADDRVDRWLRWAQLHAGRPAIYPHRELATSGTFVLAASTPGYAFSTFATDTDNVQAIRKVFNESRGRRLRPTSHRQYLEGSRTGDGALQTGSPERYAVDGGTLYVLSAPSATYAGDTMRVFFYRKPTALSAVGAMSELGEDWDEVIVAGALWRGFRALGVPERAELAKLEFGQLANEVANRLLLDHLEDHDGRTFEVEIEDYQEPTVA